MKVIELYQDIKTDIKTCMLSIDYLEKTRNYLIEKSSPKANYQLSYGEAKSTDNSLDTNDLYERIAVISYELELEQEHLFSLREQQREIQKGLDLFLTKFNRLEKAIIKAYYLNNQSLLQTSYDLGYSYGYIRVKHCEIKKKLKNC